MNFLSTLSMALKAILANKGRAVLTMLGVIIGVGSVILLTSIGTGIQGFIEQQFEDLGSNTLIITPVQVFGEGGAFGGGGDSFSSQPDQLGEDIVRDVSRMREFVKNVLPEAMQSAQVTYRDETVRTSIDGTTVEYQEVTNTPAAKGRFFNDTEERAGQRVAVLGSETATDLFGEVDPVNKEVRINDVSFTVVGVAEEKGGGGFGGPSFDSYVFIPLEAYFRLFNTDEINSISVQVKSSDQIPGAIAELERYMEEEQGRDEDEYDVFDQRAILDTINEILGILTVGLGGIAAISLVVGGIGIMNIMLVSVTERTREIGLRKAIGATPNQILMQFLIESALLSVIGGMIGVLLASLLSLLIRVVADFPSEVTPGAVLIAFGVSVAVGVIFGVAPARKASQLSPIEALRSE